MNVRDFTEYPGAEEQLMSDPGFTRLVRPACIGPVSRRPEADEVTANEIALLKHAVEGVGVSEAFMTAVSPATISMFLENQHHPDAHAYVYALADAMAPEYRAIVDSGLILQIDCPELWSGAPRSPPCSGRPRKYGRTERRHRWMGSKHAGPKA